MVFGVTISIAFSCLKIPSQNHRLALFAPSGLRYSFLACQPRQVPQGTVVRRHTKGQQVMHRPAAIRSPRRLRQLGFRWWIQHAESMQVGQRNAFGTVPFTGIDFGHNRQTGVIPLLEEGNKVMKVRKLILLQLPG